MNLRDCYIEEDLFPKIFTDYEKRGNMESFSLIPIIRILMIRTMQ